MEHLHFSKEGNMDQGIILMAGSLCNTMEYVEKIFLEHKNVLKSIEFYINGFNVNREKINGITDARWKKLLKIRERKPQSMVRKPFLIKINSSACLNKSLATSATSRSRPSPANFSNAAGLIPAIFAGWRTWSIATTRAGSVLTVSIRASTA